ncbi:MAG: dihydrolipoamide acetyltransferase family protein [Paracoccaceae bacterium]
MLNQILMPALSPTMLEGKLSKWLVKEGDIIKAGDLLAEIETDKAIMEFESSEDGILKKILIKEGVENIKVNEPIALLETPKSQKEETSLNRVVVENKNFSDKEKENTDILLNNTNSIPKNNFSNTKDATITQDRIKISPLAKRIALQNNIDFKDFKGTGPSGRIVKSDVENFIKINNVSNSSLKLKSSVKEEKDYILLNPMRKTIAERLSKSKREIPHFYLRKKIYIDKLLLARKLLNKKLESKKIKISINDIIIKAIAHALYNNPKCNVTWGEDRIIKSGSTDVALAVAIDDGLVTPVIKNIKNKTLSDLSTETKLMIERAKNKRLKAEEMFGGTITISNLGMMGIDNFDAIINPPQASILAVGKTEEVVAFDENENVVKKTIIHLSLSLDHRMIDGAIGAKFLNEIASFLEEPINLLA